MEIKKLFTKNNIEIKGPLLIIPEIFKDSRGFFYESWNLRKFNKTVERPIDFVQDNHARSCRNAIRGLHFQVKPFDQCKLVRCVSGEIFDVAVDLRKNSPTFGLWVGINLSDKNHHQLFIPEGFAHGFETLSEYSEIVYKTNNFYSYENERSVIWNDHDISINWFSQENDVVLSEKDSKAPFFKDLRNEDLF